MYLSFVVARMRGGATRTLTKSGRSVRHSCRMVPRTLTPLVMMLLVGAASVTRGAAAADPAGPIAIGPQTSLLVISPHPDDETLCCAGVIQRVLHAGGHVSVVWVTSGDGSALGMLVVAKTLFDADKMRAYGATRMREARRATALLGVPPQGQLFLGYPDGGVRAMLGHNRSQPYTSRYTDASAVPYSDALFPGHPYTGNSLEQDLAAVLTRVQPTLVLAPSPLDEHDDHRAVGLAAIAVIARAGRPVTTRYWIVHGGVDWPTPRGLIPGVPLTPSPRGAVLAPLPFTLEPDEEDRKLAALRSYLTQMQVMEPFLLSFVRSTELFSLAATAQDATP
jgi:LmbE family N-acetylglucosaminyl deacetylase